MHTYFVGSCGVLVHNVGCYDDKLQEIIDNPSLIQQYTPDEFEEIAKNSTWMHGPTKKSKDGVSKGYRAYKGNYEIRYSLNGTRFDEDHFFGKPYWVVASSKNGKQKFSMK